MQQYDRIKQYTGLVCDQIRWKKAHNIISEEIENHITDQKNAFVAAGYDESAAIDKAVEEMGDPVTVGSQLDRTHRPKTEWGMIILTVSAILIGLAVNFFVKSSIPYLSELYYFYRTVWMTALGVICMIIAYFVDFSVIGKYPKIIMALLILLIIVLYLFAFGMNGATRWIELPLIGSVSLSTLLLLFPTSYAGIIYSMRNKGYFGIIMCGVFFAITMVVILPTILNISSIFIFTLTCLVLLTVSICSGWFNVRRLYGMLTVYVPTFLISTVLVFSFFMKSYRVARIDIFLNPERDPYGAGYVMTIVRNMISGAKVLGQGTLPEIYAGDIAHYVPSMNTDYILTYLIHRVGWASFAVILILLSGFVARGFYLCFKQKSVLGKITSLSILLTLAIQMLVYISANLGYQLFAPLSLPFISYGGTYTAINLTLMGLLLSVFKSGELIRDNQKITVNNKHKLFEFVDGKIIIDLKRNN